VWATNYCLVPRATRSERPKFSRTWTESAPLPTPRPSHGLSRDRWGGETCEMNVTQWLTARRGGAVFQGHTPVHPRAIWRKRRHYEWSLVIHLLLPWPTVLARPSDQGHFPDVFRMAAYDHIHSSPFLADILTSWVLIWGCVLYIGLQILTLWQKPKVGVLIIFDGVLYSKFFVVMLRFPNFDFRSISIRFLAQNDDFDSIQF